MKHVIISGYEERHADQAILLDEFNFDIHRILNRTMLLLGYGVVGAKRKEEE